MSAVVIVPVRLSPAGQEELDEAVKRSGLTPEETVHRALKLWVEIHDLDAVGWRFHACLAATGQVMPIKDWELIHDDPEKIVTTAEIVQDPEAAKRNVQPPIGES